MKNESKNIILRSFTQVAPRGSILDSQRRVLALDIPFYEYRLDIRTLHKNWLSLFKSDDENKNITFQAILNTHKQDIDSFISQLTPILFVSPEKFNNILHNASARSTVWIMNKKVTSQQHLDFQHLMANYSLNQTNKSLDITQLKQRKKIFRAFLNAIHFAEYYRRRYPYNNIFSELLGHIQIDSDRKPFDGVEKRFDHQLRGQDGLIKYHKNLKTEVVEIIDDKQSQVMQAGEDIQLTVDYQLQHVINRELYKQLYAHNAVSASALLVEVKTGAIKSIVSQPNYNPNNSRERTAYRTRLRPLLDYIEPGSVQKPLLIAAGLESGELTAESTVSITRTNYFNWRNSPFVEPRYSKPTVVNIGEVIKYSINTGIVKFAERVSKEHLWTLFERLGYGSEYDIYEGKSGVSILSHSDNWNDSDYFTRTYGYVEKLNIINIIAFYLAVANDGILPPIHLLPKKKEQIDHQSKRVLSTQTASFMAEVLHQTTEGYGTGRLARVKGIKIAGKTGTTRKGGVFVLKYRSAFVGFAPLHDPVYVFAIIIDEPRQNEGLYSGGKVAAPVFSTVMEHAMRYYKQQY